MRPPPLPEVVECCDTSDTDYAVEPGRLAISKLQWERVNGKLVRPQLGHDVCALSCSRCGTHSEYADDMAKAIESFNAAVRARRP